MCIIGRRIGNLFEMGDSIVTFKYRSLTISNVRFAFWRKLKIRRMIALSIKDVIGYRKKTQLSTDEEKRKRLRQWIGAVIKNLR